LVGKPEGKRALGRPRRRWQDSIKMDLQEGGCGGEDPGVDGRIILRWIFRKWYVGAWTESICLRTGTGGEHL